MHAGPGHRVQSMAQMEPAKPNTASANMHTAPYSLLQDQNSPVTGASMICGLPSLRLRPGMGLALGDKRSMPAVAASCRVVAGSMVVLQYANRSTTEAVIADDADTGTGRYVAALDALQHKSRILPGLPGPTLYCHQYCPVLDFNGLSSNWVSMPGSSDNSQQYGCYCQL